eukprot:gnl/Dysnectes_brevis/1230_a1374_3797.p1 GENE.gnl/Dysnectes_brevis/1230_a1374_3797~~gnl/Dysnectes_brevis/1230_a1374_3797.p1  ORF type:complete len:149 (+),score=27.60 gnl/Dysnectes_brevis/1230_a1374_3797:91-537(+)
MINFVLLVNRQSKVRLLKWYTHYSDKERSKVIHESVQQIVGRSTKFCNIIEWRDKKLVYRRYASLYFAFCIDKDDNELLALEAIQFFVEVLDKYFGNVCELDLIFNFRKAHHILDEMIIGGLFSESSRRSVLKAIGAHASLELADSGA